MKEFSAASLVPSRAKRPGYSINRGAYIESGSEHPIFEPVDGLVIAVLEDVDHNRRVASYRAETADQFRVHREANPHLNLTAWFFEFDGAGWAFIGFGESPESLWEAGSYAAP